MSPQGGAPTNRPAPTIRPDHPTHTDVTRTFEQRRQVYVDFYGRLDSAVWEFLGRPAGARPSALAYAMHLRARIEAVRLYGSSPVIAAANKAAADVAGLGVPFDAAKEELRLAISLDPWDGLFQ